MTDHKHKLYAAHELFHIPDEKRIIIYAPLEKKILNLTAEQNNLLVDILKKQGIAEEEHLKHIDFIQILKKNHLISEEPVNEKAKLEKYRFEDIPFEPTAATLFPTSLCNLKCIYCYASAGETAVQMEFEIAQKSIDFIVENALKRKTLEVSLGFHGGGEPFINFDLMKKSVAYLKNRAESEGLKVKLSAVTNGCLTDMQIQWVIDNKLGLTISFDGPRDLQEKQRPVRTGASSYDWVLSTAKELKINNSPFGFRATVSDEGTTRLSEIVEHIYSLELTKGLHVEPLSYCGRCNETQAAGPEPHLFVKKYFEAKEKAKKLGIDFYCAADRVGQPGLYFCGSLGNNFALTPEGHISSCFEVTKPTDPLADMFFYGKYNKEKGTFEIDTRKLDMLKNRSSLEIEHCADCFSKYDCRGGCPAKIKNIFQPEDYHCIISQEINKENIIRMVQGEKNDK